MSPTFVGLSPAFVVDRPASANDWPAFVAVSPTLAIDRPTLAEVWPTFVIVRPTPTVVRSSSASGSPLPAGGLRLPARGSPTPASRLRRPPYRHFPPLCLGRPARRQHKKIQPPEESSSETSEEGRRGSLTTEHAGGRPSSRSSRPIACGRSSERSVGQRTVPVPWACCTASGLAPGQNAGALSDPESPGVLLRVRPLQSLECI